MYNRVKNIKKEKLFYVWDFIILAVVLAVAIASLCIFLKPDGNQVEIYVDGTLKYTYSLSEERTITIDDTGHNVIQIKDGKVTMLESDCPNQYCVTNGSISKVGQQIVCLPHKLVVVITGDGEAIDAQT